MDGGLENGGTERRRIGRFALGPIVGHGGMGVVHRARDTDLGREVALKLIAPSLAGDTTFRARFEAEARAAAAIDHPNVLPVFEAGEADGDLYLAMRLVEGADLRAILTRETRLPRTRTAEVVAQIAAALDAAHARGLVHRDVKPANALIAAEGTGEHVYLTDFGLTQAHGDGGGLTSAGQVVGTANYIAPEQVGGRETDGRVDVYALACVAFECLVGEPPFARATTAATLSAHLRDEIPSAVARVPELPGDVDEVLCAGLAKRPADRFASAGALARALGTALARSGPVRAGEPPVAPRARPRPTAPAPVGAPAAAPASKTAVAAPRRRRGAWRWVLVGLLVALALGGMTAAVIALAPSQLVSGDDGASADRTIGVLGGAGAVNQSLSTLLSRLAGDPTGEAVREDQRRRLPALRERVSRLRSAADRVEVDAAARPLLVEALQIQEEVIDQYGRLLDADPTEAQPIIEEMIATLARIDASLRRAR